jgi:hypothetical protein
MGEKIEPLEHHPDLAALEGNFLLAQPDNPPVHGSITDHVAIDEDLPVVDLFQMIDASDECRRLSPLGRPLTKHHPEP